MKIGLYTIHSCNNYGALLQSYSTVNFLYEKGYDVEIVNVTSSEEEDLMNYRRRGRCFKSKLLNLYVRFHPLIQKKISRVQSFRNLLPLSRRYYSHSEVAQDPPVYDVHMVGSDQVWNVEKGMGDGYFFLPFLAKGSSKISFASSFGNIDSVRGYKEEVSKYLSDFSRRSVRELESAVFLTSECNLKTDAVLDPTFLLSSEKWSELAGDQPIVKGNYALYYGFDQSSFCKDSITLIREELNMPVIGVSVSIHSPYSFDKFIIDAGPREFLNLVKYASFILTSSFHGMAFSVIFRKEFCVIKYGTRMSRMVSCLSTFNLKERIVENIEDLKKTVRKPIAYDEVIITEKVDYTRNWLIHSLSGI